VEVRVLSSALPTFSGSVIPVKFSPGQVRLRSKFAIALASGQQEIVRPLAARQDASRRTARKSVLREACPRTFSSLGYLTPRLLGKMSQVYAASFASVMYAFMTAYTSAMAHRKRWSLRWFLFKDEEKAG
jgi:hypothetical protein